MADAPEDDYKVGPRKPPREYQWKPGQSGHPEGRPKRQPTTAKCFAGELNQKISVVENGERVRITKRRAFAKRVVNGALNGSAQDTKTLLHFVGSSTADKNRRTFIIEE